jgi:hypothetical protein
MNKTLLSYAGFSLDDRPELLAYSECCLLSLHHICFNDITFMVRTQIQLTDEQYTHLKELSLRSHKSLAEMIRVAVDRLLMTEQPDRAALYRQSETVVSKYSAPAIDISVEHDRYLDDAFSS